MCKGTVSSMKSLLRKLGLVRYAKQTLKPWYQRRAMRFPSFPADSHTSILFHPDYFRYATMGLAVQRLEQEGVAGSFAEVGVYQGHTSRFIHHLAPARTYYLFDTFSGFPASDLDPATAEDDRFQDTTVELVRKNIGGNANIVIRPGYVPDTLGGLEEQRFAFVLLDLDLHKPTLQSLEFFYPRLARGAYLIVHDYNSPESNWACKRALDGFMADKPEQIIEIADMWGTALFRKM